MTGLVTGGPRGVLEYRLPLGLSIPISPSLFLIISTQSSMTSLLLQENLMAIVSKLMTKLHSESAGMRVGLM